jgi:signal transduction histidine kinase/HAMP domain-containing protein
MRHSRHSSVFSVGHCSLARLLQKIPLRLLLTAPNLIQLLTVVALVGVLSWWHGRQTVNRLAFQLESEIGERVQLKLESYLNAPHLITQINQDAVQLGHIDLNSPASLEPHLLKQIAQFPSVSGILLGSEQGLLRAVNRRGGLHMLKVDPAEQGVVRDYKFDAAGRANQVNKFIRPEVRQFSWYRAAATAQRAVWSPIFQTPDNRDLSLNVNLPIYGSDGKLVGVASSGVVLSVIDQFLDQIRVSASGLVFIVERNGKLIATSTEVMPYGSQQQTGKTTLTQISAIQSSQPTIRQTARQLQARFGQFSQITTSQQFTLVGQGQANYVRVVPYSDPLGLDWLIVVVIPQTDFMAQINSNTRTTVWLCLGTVLVTIASGAIASNWMARPMQQLSRASQAISEGDLNRRVPQNQPIQEMQTTASAFNRMAEKLSLSFNQIETANVTLEEQVQAQTTELRQALQFEDLLRRITEKVRDSLDEAQILQTAVRELALGLKVQGCDVALYDLEAAASVISYEYLTADLAAAQGKVFPFAALPHLYQQLLQRQTTQFCLLEPHLHWSSSRQWLANLACPITDDQGVLGDLWLFKPSQTEFSLQEVRLVEQVANQCAIALRQSRLYQTAQIQVQELEHLHRIKDDFLNTVSHELRTPMANIRMATQLLEMSLERAQFEAADVQRYLTILQEEGNREITLINNLLDLSRLDAGTEPYMPTTIDPTIWLPHIVEPFMERAKLQQQQLQVDLPDHLPALTTDLADLERILSELLNNACKYTPAGEQIAVTAWLTQLETPPVASPRTNPPPQPAVAISVANSGTEIAAVEQERIFDKFYRIASHDPWKHGGTGLGLALVKGLVERLSGQISVESQAGVTRFTVMLPLLRG